MSLIGFRMRRAVDVSAGWRVYWGGMVRRVACVEMGHSGLIRIVFSDGSMTGFMYGDVRIEASEPNLLSLW